MHSQGYVKAAIDYYEKANDILALTKIYCSLNDVVKVSYVPPFLRPNDVSRSDFIFYL